MGRETRYAVYLLYGCLDVRRYYRGDAYVLWHHNSDCLVAPNKLVASAIAAIPIEFIKCTLRLGMSALPPKAVIAEVDCDVHFVPEADIGRTMALPSAALLPCPP